MKMKRVITIILCLVMLVGNFSAVFGETTSNFDFEGHWAQATIQKWVDEERISGYPDGSFKPNSNITRAEFVKLVNGLVDFNTKGNISFKDVNTTDWFYNVVSIASEIGYISGYPNNTFGPNENITREQAAAILSRIQYLGENTDAAKKFSDNSKISSWALGTVGAASSVGFINGYENGSFKPLNNLTRAEAVTMLDNVLMNAKNKVITKAGTELNNYVVDGDLIIAKTVGEGDVHLNNVTVNGTLYVYGGGVNSLYFNKLKVNKIIVEKDKVRLVLGEGSVVEEISVGSETVLQNDDGTVSKITISSDSKVTLSGSFDTVNVNAKSNVVLKDAKIKNFTADNAITISGTGTIATLTANVNGIKFDSTLKITKTVVGPNVTEKPEVIASGGGTVGGGGGGGDVTPTTPTYRVSVNAEIKEGLVTSSIGPINTEPYTNTSIISDFLVSQLIDILNDIDNSTVIDKYLGIAENRLKGIKIKQTPLYINGTLNDEAWDKAVSYLNETDLAFKNKINDTLEADFANGLETADLLKILAIYDTTYKVDGTLDKNLLQGDLTKITNKLEDNFNEISYAGSGTFTVTYNVGKSNQESFSTQAAAVDFIVTNIAFSTKTVEEFFNEFGNVTITAAYGDKTSTITIVKLLIAD